MEFGGRYRIEASRTLVWEALNSPEILQACIPGCQHIAWVSDSQLEAKIGVNLGVVKPTFTGDLTLSNVVPAVSYTLTGQGRGGLLGKAQASADITLEDAGEATILTFVAQGGASAQIMKLGKAIIGNQAQRIIDGFFIGFANAMGAEITPISSDEEKEKV